MRGVHATVLEVAGDKGTAVGGAKSSHNDR